MRTASEVPTIAIEIAKSRSTVDEGPCVPEELDEDEDAAPDMVPELLLVCDVKEVVDEVQLEEPRTSKLSHI